MDAAKILVFQTAFIGDVILTLPLVQVLHRQMPDVMIDVVAIPATAGLLQNHPAINRVIVYDKRGADRGARGAISLVRRLGALHYDAALIPHRSLRSGLICFGAGIHRRIGFSTSAAPWLLTDVVPYRKEKHHCKSPSRRENCLLFFLERMMLKRSGSFSAAKERLIGKT